VTQHTEPNPLNMLPITIRNQPGLSEPSNQSHLHARAHAGSAQPGSGAQPGPASHWQPITPLSIRGFWDSALLITCSGWIWIGLSESGGSPFGGSYRAVRVGVWHPKRTDLVPISSATRKSGLVDQQDGLCWSEIVKCVQDRGSWVV